MKKKRKLLVGNWKMNPQTLEEAKKLFSGIKKQSQSLLHTDIVLCPPHLFVSDVVKINKQKIISVGVQNVYFESAGAFTGEIGPIMAREIGCSYTLVGHSERRTRGESDEVVGKKVKLALSEGLKVILCIGEKERDSEGNYLGFIIEQLKHSLLDVSKNDLDNLIVAYEPVWAIGKTDAEAMKGKDMHEMSIFIRRTLGELFNSVDVSGVKILYGGSVSSNNTADLVGNGEVDGLLVGRQSLAVSSFMEIAGIVDTI